MKRICWSLLATLLFMSLLPLGAFAEEPPATPTVYVTIVKDVVDDVLDYNPFATERLAVAVTDADADGALTVNDALILAHAAQYDGGAEAGYAYSVADGEVTVNKLWGTADTAYGFYLNHEAAIPATAIQDGDNLCAYVSLPDVQDVYACFDKDAVTVAQNEPITLTLKVRVQTGDSIEMRPLADAWIYVDNMVIPAKTDADGKATIALEPLGLHTVRAISYTHAIVAPICMITVTESASDAPDQIITPEQDFDEDHVITLPELNLDTDTNGEGDSSFRDWGWVIAGAVAVTAVIGLVIVIILRRRK